VVAACDLDFEGRSTHYTSWSLEQSILDMGDGNASGLVLASARSALLARITRGGAVVCSVNSSYGSVPLDTWMTIVLQFNASDTTMSLSKDGVTLAGPAACASPPADGTVTRMWIGKSNAPGGNFLDGEIAGVYVADSLLQDVSRTCRGPLSQYRNGSNVSAARRGGGDTNGTCTCAAVQSSTNFSSFNGPEATSLAASQAIRRASAASWAVDSSEGSCAQTLIEADPWWRLDLEHPRLIVSVRLRGLFDSMHGWMGGTADLAGSIQVRLGPWPRWQANAVCGSGAVSAPGKLAELEITCHGQGSFLFITAPGPNRSLSLCDVKVLGLELPTGSTSFPSTSFARSGAGLSAVLVPNCSSCVEGTFKETIGSERCELCAGGFYSPVRASQASSDCQACPAGTYQDMPASSACLSCGGTTTSSSRASTLCKCNAGYSGLPGGAYSWQLQGVPPFEARWLTAGAAAQEVLRVSTRCGGGGGGGSGWCGAGEEVLLEISSRETGGAWASNLTMVSVPLSLPVLFNGSGFFFPTHSLE